MLKNIIEALLFAAGDGLSMNEIMMHFAADYTEKEIKSVMKELEKEYSGEKGIHLITYRDKRQFQTNPEYGARVADVLKPIKEKELSKTLLEVLAIIAYKQPITRSEIEDIRYGSGSEYAVQMLQKFGLIDVVGRKETIGRPVLFGTTDEFLKKFRLSSLDDLPDYDELLLQLKQNFDSVYKKSDELFREHLTDEDVQDKDAPTEIVADFFKSEDDEMPEFLKGEEVELYEVAADVARESNEVDALPKNENNTDGN